MRGRLTLLALVATCSVSTQALAVEWIEGPRDQRFRGTPAEAAQTFLHEQKAALKLDGVELVADARLRIPTSTTVRFVQRLHGLPVLNSSAAVRVSDDGRVLLAVMDVARDVRVETKPSLSAERAAEVVRAQAGASSTLAPRLAVLPDEGHGGALVWMVDAPTKVGGERFLIDAHTGSLRGRRLLAMNVKGRVYKVSLVKTPQPTDEPLLDLDVSTPQRLNGNNGQVGVFEYVSGGEQQQFTAEQTIGPNSGEDFLYDPPASKDDPHDEFSALNAYYHIHRIREFYTSKLAVDMSDSKWALGVVSNALDSGQPLDNAFFSEMGLSDPSRPNLIAIGQGHTDFAYDSDVFMHEFTHYVSKNAIDYNEGQFGMDTYGLTSFGGSIDEGIADYFACTVNDDPKLGEGVLGGSQRDLSVNDKRCPESLIGEVHEDGKIIGSSAWEIREKLGAELADQLVWGGFSMLVHGTSLGDFATGVTKTAEEFAGAGKMTDAQVDQVKAIFADRALDDCGRVLSLNKESRHINMLGLQVIGQFFGGGGCKQLTKYISLQSGFHFSYKPEPNAKRIRFDVTLKDQGGFGDLDWGIYVRKGKPVPFNPSGNGFPEVGNADFSELDNAASDGSLEIGAGTDRKLDPSATYYAVIVHKNCPVTSAEIKATSFDGPAETEGAGGSAAAGAAGSGGSAAGKGGSSGTAGKGGGAGKPASSVGGSAPVAAGASGAGGGGGQGGVQGGPGIQPLGDAEPGGGCDCGVSGQQPAGASALAAVAALAAAVARRRRR